MTGESGSTRSATTSRICASVRMRLWPKRGMLLHAAKASGLYTLPHAYLRVSSL